MDLIIKIFLLVVVIGGIVFFVSSHYKDILPKGNLGNYHFSFFPSSGTSTVFGFQLGPWPQYKTGNPLSFTFSSPLAGGYGYLQNAVSNYAIPQGFTRSQLSPYFGQFKIYGSASYSFFGSQTTQLQLYSYLPPGQTADVTGWHIKGKRGDVLIPQAVNFYNWTGLSPETDIVISGNGALNFYSNTSAIRKNLRLNKCIGFLQKYNPFNPALPQNCPALYRRDDIIHLSGFCESYIMSLGACQVPDSGFYNALPPTAEGNACRDYLNTLTPKSCWDNHQSDPDFLSNTWLVWINQNPLDPFHDQLNLYDRNGLLVDQYSY